MKMKENAHKITFLVQQYPEHPMAKIIGLLAMPAIEINTAIWYAVEHDLLTEPDEKTGIAQLGENVPTEWKFGESAESLIDMLEYAFSQLAKKQADLEETYLANWTAGYSGQDTLIATKYLIERKILAQYELADPEDEESIYTFFTLYENREKLWGRAQFKKAPTEEAPIPTETKQTEEEGE